MIRHLAAKTLVLAVVGIGVGVLTAILQSSLNFPWLGLVNAASPWLAVMFAAGAAWRWRLVAASAGLPVGLLELVGYCVTDAIRHHPTGSSILVFWVAWAVVGGPVFGWAGREWWRSGPLGGLGGSVVPAAFFAEALIAYWVRLGYESTAILFGVVGLVLYGLLGLHGHQHLRMARWLAITFPVGVVAELVLGLIYNQAF